MKEIVVKTQEEMDAVDIYFDGIIKIIDGKKIKITKRYRYPVESWGNSTIVTWGDSTVVALDNSSVRIEAGEGHDGKENGNHPVRGTY